MDTEPGRGQPLHGIISDGSGAGRARLVKQGAGRLTLGGANTYTGETTVNGGTLAIANNSALGSETGSLGTTVNPDGILELRAARPASTSGTKP